jgi:hypothetical protein
MPEISKNELDGEEVPVEAEDGVNKVDSEETEEEAVSSGDDSSNNNNVKSDGGTAHAPYDISFRPSSVKFCKFDK